MSHSYTVWAPDARTVDLRLGTDGATTVPMTRGDGGWWRVEHDPGDGRYAYSVDGGSPAPDPRSRWQPDGVHGPSALVDTSAFTWTDHDWEGVPLRGSAIYELHVDTFTPQRTFDGVIERLDHLVDLGVDVVEIMPVAAFPGSHGWGYDGVALYAVHEPYGGPEGLARLVDAAHARGLAVWLDVVYNHLGPSGNYLHRFGPYFTDRHHTPWGQAVNLDGPGSDEVRAFILDNVRLWLQDYHVDGLRLDAVHALHDDRAVHLLEELATLADEISALSGIPRTLVAESDRNDPATVARRGPGGAGGTGLHGQWADDIHHALHAALTGETQAYFADFADPGALSKVLGRSPFFHDGTFSTFRGRTHGRPVDPQTSPGWRFVGSLQTHDQIGNRAAGDRIGHGMTAGRHAIGAALLLTSPYTPMLFMGEEFAASTPWQYFTDHSEDWLAEAISQGRKREFAEHGWSGDVPDPQDEGTVEASTLRWDEVAEPRHAQMLGWYRTLLRLRRELPALRETPLGEGEVCREPTVDAQAELVTVRRGDVSVIAVLGDGSAEVFLDRGAAGDGAAGDGATGDGATGDAATGDGPTEVLASFGAVEVDGRRLRLGPDSVAVMGAGR